jgi:hypothetical protein
MNWKGFPEEPPTETGKYTASIMRPMPAGQYVFSDLAHYDAETKTWYKYDPFEDKKYEPKEDITNMVVGWADDMGAFMGVVGG